MTFPEIRLSYIFCLGRAKGFSVLGVFTAVRFAAKTTYRHAVRRKANLEVTGEEKPKTRLKRRKANKSALSRKKASLGPPRRRKASFTCLRRKKGSLRRPRAKNYNKRHLAREKNRNLLAKILLILLISRTRNLESIYLQCPAIKALQRCYE